jgi:hypothetical protein
MTQDMRNWVSWVRVLADPASETRGFTLEGLEFKVTGDPVEDEMYGTLPGDRNVQRGKFWVVSEAELMRVCPQMQTFAQGEDWFFPVEFCDHTVRPEGIEPVQTRDATSVERAEALSTFGKVQEKLSQGE